MAAPAWSDVVQSQSASLVTPIVVTMPTNLATGDRVVIFITMGRNRTQGLNWNTGTTGFVSALGGTTFNTAGNDHEHDFGYRDISGTPPATISITPSQSKAFIAWAGRIPAGTFDPATAPEFTTTPNVADPANLDPSWTEDTLFIAGISADELTFISFPLADDQDSEEISNVSGAVCSIGQTGGGARNVAAWATTEANLKGVAVVCIRAATASATDLVVQDASQAQSADTPSLTQLHVLTVADSAQAHSVDNVTLTQVHNLVVQDATQSQSSDSPTLTVGAVDLVVQDSAQAQSADNVTLTQAHSLAVQDAAHAQTADAPTLTQTHILQAQDASQAQTVDSPALTQVHVLVVQDSTHSQVADNVTITVGGIDLLVADALQTMVVESPALTQVHQLTVADAHHVQTADTVSLGNPDLATPPERHVTITAEARRLTTPTDARALTIPRDSRTVT